MKSQKLMAMVVSICLTMIACSSINPVPKQDTHIANSTFTEKLTEIEQPVVVEVEKVNPEELDCMKHNLYFEAGDQPIKGMEAVALVTINRTRTNVYPQTVCGVVRQVKVYKSGRRICQFTWFCDRKPDAPNLFITIKTKKGVKIVPNLAEQRAWANAEMVARNVLEGNVENFIGKATHYHGNYVSPSWSRSKRMRRIAVIGTHIFYTDLKLKLRGA